MELEKKNTMNLGNNNNSSNGGGEEFDMKLFLRTVDNRLKNIEWEMLKNRKLMEKIAVKMGADMRNYFEFCKKLENKEINGSENKIHDIQY